MKLPGIHLCKHALHPCLSMFSHFSIKNKGYFQAVIFADSRTIKHLLRKLQPLASPQQGWLAPVLLLLLLHHRQALPRLHRLVQDKVPWPGTPSWRSWPTQRSMHREKLELWCVSHCPIRFSGASMQMPDAVKYVTLMPWNMSLTRAYSVRENEVCHCMCNCLPRYQIQTLPSQTPWER